MNFDSVHQFLAHINDGEDPSQDRIHEHNISGGLGNVIALVRVYTNGGLSEGYGVVCPITAEDDNEILGNLGGPLWSLAGEEILDVSLVVCKGELGADICVWNAWPSSHGADGAVVIARDNVK